MVDTFIQFLKDRGAYERYIYNIRDVGAVGKGKDQIKDLLLREPPITFLTSSFIWRDTLHGNAYWYELDIKWRVYLYKNTQK